MFTPLLLVGALLSEPTAVVVRQPKVVEVLVNGKSIRRTQADIGELKATKVAGSATVVASWTETSGKVQKRFYGISLDGSTWNKVGETSATLTLRYREFDPLKGVPAVEPELKSRTDNELDIVQFVTPIVPAYHDAVENAGGSVFTYLANNAYICRLTPEARKVVKSWSFVRWAGPYEPAYRLEPEARTALFAGTLGTRRYNIQVSDWTGESKFEVARKIETLGGTAVAAPGGSFMTADLNPQQLTEALSWNEVFWIDRWSPAEEDMNIVRSVGGADMLSSLPIPYRGEGVRGEDMDGSFLSTHFDFQRAPAPIVRSNGTSSFAHGTSTFGINFGSGASDPTGKGMLPAAQGIFGTYNSLTTFGGSTTRYAWTQALVGPTYRGMYQSNSWGSSLTTQYTSISTEMDQIVFDLDIPIFQSQSNNGDQNSRPQAWAKNVVSVGGISHFNTPTLTDDQWTGASIGPAADGRLKPDICNWYDSIYTTTSTSNTAYTSGFNGTSAATPITAGTSGLLFQIYADGVFGNTITATNPYDARPHSTFIKAMMCNQAIQYPFSGTGAINSRYKQGWGLSNILNSYNVRNNVYFVNEEDVINPLQTKSYRTYVAAGTAEFKATMVYNDLPGTTSSLLHRINDLTLKVTAPNGTVYYGNNGLAAGNYSTPGGSPNTVDNVENVFVQNPASGVWLVEVSGDSITLDGHTETGQIDADYALVVSGVSMTALATANQMEFGAVRSGGLTELETSNNRRMVLEAGLDTNDTAYERIQNVVTGTSPVANPTKLTFRVEALNGESGVSQRIQLWNYTLGRWDQVDYVPLPGAETVREAVVTSGATDYVQPGTRQVKARTTWWRFVINDVDWTIGVDQARWFFTP